MWDTYGTERLAVRDGTGRCRRPPHMRSGHTAMQMLQKRSTCRQHQVVHAIHKGASGASTRLRSTGHA